MRTWLVSDAVMPAVTISWNSSMLYAMPPPVPPSVNAGRMMLGKAPMSACTASASAIVVAVPDLGVLRPMSAMATLKSSRSSAWGVGGGGGASAARAARQPVPLPAPSPLLPDLVDGRQLGPDELHPVLGQDAALLQRLGEVERGLAPHRREHGVGPLLVQDLLHQLGRHGADVGAVRGAGVGHDGGLRGGGGAASAGRCFFVFMPPLPPPPPPSAHRVGVEQDDAVAFSPEGERNGARVSNGAVGGAASARRAPPPPLPLLALERFARLRAGVVKLARLGRGGGGSRRRPRPRPGRRRGARGHAPAPARPSNRPTAAPPALSHDRGRATGRDARDWPGSPLQPELGHRSPRAPAR